MIRHIDIAKALNTSAATVSNAFSGKGRMSPELRSRIFQVADQMGYKRKVKTLQPQHQRIHVLIEQMSVVICHRIMTGVCKAAREHNLNLQISDMGILDYEYGITPPVDWLSEYAREFLRHVDDSTMGVIYISQYPRDITGVLPQFHYPVVYAGGYNTDGSYCVNYDDEKGAYMATSHLLEKGCKRPAMICGPIDNVPTSNRWIGFQRAIIDHGLPLDPDMIKINKDWEIEGGHIAMKEFLSLPEIPDGIFAHNDEMAFGAAQAANEYGLRVPEDLKLIGMDNAIPLYTSVHTAPKISTVETPLREIGVISIETLLQIQSGNIPAQRNITIPCTLLSRESG